MASVGIDIGGTSVKAVRDDAGHLAVARVAHHASEPSLREAVREAARAVAAQPVDLAGLCLPGLTDRSTGVLTYAANLRCLEGTPLRPWLAETTGLHAGPILTDALAAGLGAHAARPVAGRLLTLAMGTGIGAAFLINGEPRTIDGFTPGHLGQIDVSGDEPEPPTGPDGGRGSVEAYLGWPALRARFGNDAGPRIAALPDHDPAVRALVRLVRIAHAIYKPDVIRLIGGVGPLFDPLLPAIHRLASSGLTAVAQPGWSIDTLEDPFLAARGVARVTARAPGSDASLP